MLVGDHDSSMSSIAWPASVELALELVERLARVRPGVDEGQRLVLDQVAVDPPDRERGRDLQPRGCPPLRRCAARLGLARASRADQRQDLVALCLHVLARDERLEVEAQQRLGVRGPDVEVPVGVVDRDAVEPGDLGVRSARPRSPSSSPRWSATSELISPEMKYASRSAPTSSESGRPSAESSSSTSSAGIVPESAHQKSRK